MIFGPDDVATVHVRCRICDYTADVPAADENRWYETHHCEDPA